MLRVAALQYCASDDVAKHCTISTINAEAAQSKACCPNIAPILLQASNYSKRPNGTMKAIAKMLGNVAREFGIWLLAGSLIMRRRDNNQLATGACCLGPTASGRGL